jgi:hypothetical protein
VETVGAGSRETEGRAGRGAVSFPTTTALRTGTAGRDVATGVAATTAGAECGVRERLAAGEAGGSNTAETGPATRSTTGATGSGRSCVSPPPWRRNADKKIEVAARPTGEIWLAWNTGGFIFDPPGRAARCRRWALTP